MSDFTMSSAFLAEDFATLTAERDAVSPCLRSRIVAFISLTVHALPISTLRAHAIAIAMFVGVDLAILITSSG